MDIEALRSRIDEIDSRLVDLLNERARCAQQIGQLKRGHELPIYEPRREQVILDNVRRKNSGPLPDMDLLQVYERIIDVMRKIQLEQIGVPEQASGGSEMDEND